MQLSTEIRGVTMIWMQLLGNKNRSLFSKRTQRVGQIHLLGKGLKARKHQVSDKVRKQDEHTEKIQSRALSRVHKTLKLCVMFYIM